MPELSTEQTPPKKGLTFSGKLGIIGAVIGFLKVAADPNYHSAPLPPPYHWGEPLPPKNSSLENKEVTPPIQEKAPIKPRSRFSEQIRNVTQKPRDTLMRIIGATPLKPPLRS